MTSLVDTLLAGGPWMYIGFLVLAVAEAFVVTTYLLSGTLVFVAVGTLIVLGKVDPAVVVLIYAGTVLGDCLSFALSGRLQNIGWIKNRVKTLDRFRGPLALSPIRFFAAAHMAPYLRGATAFLAGGILPWNSFLQAELVGALVGTAFFLGLGMAGGFLVIAADDINAVGLTVGTVAVVVIVITWIRVLRPCKLVRIGTVSTSRRTWSRGLGLLYYACFWHPVRWIEGALRRLPSRALRRNLAQAFPDVRAGDIFLVRLHAPAPWGTWAHSAIAIGGDRFAHGFGGSFSAHRLEALPVRYAICHLRVGCSDEAAGAAAAAASALIGTPVSIWAGPRTAKSVSCASAVALAYEAAGISLWPLDGARIVPDDLFRSNLVQLIRIVYTEQRRPRHSQKAPNAR
jgi:membrane protein DedA with SNARE-associated domain